MCQLELQAGSGSHSVDTTIPPRIDLHQRTCEPMILESNKSLLARLLLCVQLWHTFLLSSGSEPGALA